MGTTNRLYISKELIDCMNEIIYTLMNRNDPVMDVSLLPDSTIFKILTIHNVHKLPIGIPSPEAADLDKICDAFKGWWRRNSIPVDRDSIRLGLECLGIDNINELKILGYGLSLTNQYWMCPKGTEVSWDKINYFTNSFSDAMGEALFNHRPQRSNNDFAVFFSPDSSADGMLKKKWRIENNTRMLIKGGTGFLSQEPFNEFLAYKLFEAAGIPAVPYSVVEENGSICSKCPCFLKENTELITAFDLLNAYPTAYNDTKNIDYYTHYKNVLRRFHILNYEKMLDVMLCIDYLIANTDRHYKNFGIVHDVDQDSYWMAPMYDSGTSMWATQMTKNIVPLENIQGRPFSYNSFIYLDEQITFVSSFTKFHSGVLDSILNEYKNLMSDYSDIPQDRIHRLCDSVQQRYSKMLSILKENHCKIE